MKRSHWKRVAAFLITLSVLCQSLPAAAFAAEIPEEPVTAAEGEVIAPVQTETPPEMADPSAGEKGSVSNETPAPAVENPAAPDETPADPGKEASENGTETGKVSENAGSVTISENEEAVGAEATIGDWRYDTGKTGNGEIYLTEYIGASENVTVPAIIEIEDEEETVPYQVNLDEGFNFGPNKNRIVSVKFEETSIQYESIQAYYGCMRNVFKGMSALETVDFGNFNENYEGPLICDGMFEDCSALKDVKFFSLPNVQKLYIPCRTGSVRFLFG